MPISFEEKWRKWVDQHYKRARAARKNNLMADAASVRIAAR